MSQNNYDNKIAELIYGKARRYLTFIIVCVSVLFVVTSKYAINNKLLLGLNDLHVFLLEILNSISIAILTGAVIGIIIDLKEWREYFGSHIRELIIDNSYLKDLTEEKLQELERNIARIRYNTIDGDKKSSLFFYLKNRVYVLIKEPYRREVAIGLKIKSNIEYNEIFETLQYWCCPVNGKNIELLYWTWDEDEVLEVSDIRIEIRLNSEESKALECKAVLEKNDLQKYFMEKIDGNKEKGYVVNIKDIIPKEKEFCVNIISNYKLRKWMFYSWRSAYATKGIHISLSYVDCNMYRSIGGVLDSEYIEYHNEDKKFYEYSQSEWALPQSSIVFQFK